jgi:hypothetical protein
VKKELAQNIIKESYRASNTLYIMTSQWPRSIVSDSAHPAAYGKPFNGGWVKWQLVVLGFPMTNKHIKQYLPRTIYESEAIVSLFWNY